MQLTQLKLKNFRRYDSAEFAFSEGVNVIYGPNATGKTTILEALYCCICGRSFRSHRLFELLKTNEDCFKIDLRFTKYGIEQVIQLVSDGKKRKISHNHNVLGASSKMLGLVQGVVLTPNDVNLIKGGPALRRQFIDILLVQVDPLYVYYLTRYHRAVKQRNVLLKQNALKSISAWEEEMAQAAAYITKQRLDLLPKLQNEGRRFYERITLEKSDLSLNLKHPHLIVKDDLAKQYRILFEKMRQRDREFSATQAGPHRDDICISAQKRALRDYASEGEQRAFVVALKFAEWHVLKDRSEIKPLMLLDDVAMSLDFSRRENLMEAVQELGQVFLTSTEHPEADMRCHAIKTSRQERDVQMA